METKFNHKYKKLNDALGISDSEAERLSEISLKAYTECSCISEGLEQILNHGLSMIELAYCCYILGYNDAANNEVKKEEITGGLIIGPDGKEIPLDKTRAQKLKDLLEEFQKLRKPRDKED